MIPSFTWTVCSLWSPCFQPLASALPFSVEEEHRIQSKEYMNTTVLTKQVALLSLGCWLAAAPWGKSSLINGVQSPPVVCEMCFQCSRLENACSGQKLSIQGEDHLCRSKTSAINEIRGTSNEKMTEGTHLLTGDLRGAPPVLLSPPLLSSLSSSCPSICLLTHSLTHPMS